MRVTFPPQGAPGISQSTEVRHHRSYRIVSSHAVSCHPVTMHQTTLLHPAALQYIDDADGYGDYINVYLLILSVTVEACVFRRGGLELWTQGFQGFHPHDIREIHQGK